LLGRPLAQLAGRPFFAALPGLLGQGVKRVLDGVRQSGVAYAAQEREIHLERHRPGESGFFNFVYQPLRDEQGRITGITCVAIDVSEQVLARRRVEQSERQLQLITDALPVLIGYLDRDEKYRFTNQAYEAWFNQRPADLLGQTIYEVVGEKAYRGIKGYIDRALAGERLDFEAQMPYREDFLRYIRTSYVPDLRNGQVVGFYTMVADTTEQVLARQQVQALNEELAATNEELAAINEELQASNEELGETNQKLTRTNADLDNFVYVASHDLKAPIANIEGLLYALTEQLAEASQTDEQVPTILGMMQGAVERFQKTIDHLTDITKLQKEQVQLSEPVDLVAVVEEVRLDLAPLLQATAARLDLDLADCPVVSFSQKNLRSVVYNLLSNAVKYRAPDRVPRVRIQSRQQNGYAVLEVQDNGLGLDATQQARLFGMFQRLHDHVEGTGIGLYMVKRMVENGGGQIRVESQPGVGSTFIISLPAVNE
ncbi:MAG: PAS domain-containing protein, partial [Hymenobacter sp.]|nr:PAS domain-containing protein [Hymenobacter sp.]